MQKIDSFTDKHEALAWILKNVPGIKTSSDAEKYLFSKLPKESYYQTQIMKAVKKKYPNAFMWKAAAGPYSRQGIPDVCVVIEGMFYGLEIKRPYVGVLSPIQRQTIKLINQAGGTAGVVCFPEEALALIEKGAK